MLNKVSIRSGWLLSLCAASTLCTLLAPAGARAADLTATPSTLGSVFALAKGGDRILLASGDYGTFRGGSKPSIVTLAPQAGATPVIKLSLAPADHMTFDGLTIKGGVLSGAHDI